MTRSMTRWTLAGFMALAALGGVTVLDVGPATADAAPSASEFAGTYDWDWLPVTISDGGRIAGSASSGYGGEYSYEQSVSITGRVGADGGYSFTKIVTTYFYDLFGRRHRVGKSGHASAGTIALDANGNIVGTTDDGGSFFWLRR